MRDHQTILWVIALAFYGLLCLVLLALRRKAPRHRRWTWIIVLYYLAGFSAVPVVCLLLLWLPEALVWGYHPSPADKPLELIGQYRLMLAQILGGSGFLFGVSLAWLQFRATMHKDFAERFYRSAELLGSQSANGILNYEARLAAIQSLERLRKDSEEYHWPVVELLCAYVRLNSLSAAADPDEESHPREDVAAALDAIAFRTDRVREQQSQRLDLTRARLGGAYLAKSGDEGVYGGDLGNAYFWYCDLRYADLRCNNLQGAQLQGAKLGRALLAEADFLDAKLHEGKLSDDSADLRDANLSETKNLTYEQIEHARGDATTVLPLGMKRPELWDQPQAGS